MPSIYPNAKIYKPAKTIEPKIDNAGRQSVNITKAIDSQPKPSRTYYQLPPI